MLEPISQLSQLLHMRRPHSGPNQRPATLKRKPRGAGGRLWLPGAGVGSALTFAHVARLVVVPELQGLVDTS